MMTEDDVRFRFEIVKGKEWIKDYGSDSVSKYDIYEGLYSVTKLLNKLHMENMGLKSSNMEYYDALGRLEEENLQLKKDLVYYKTERKALFEYIDKKDDLKLELKCGDLNGG